MSLLDRWWFDDALLLSLCAAPLLGAALLSPSPEVVTLFGWEVPPLCASRLVLGVECMGCGMTRSFSFLAHGDLLSAWAMNKLGIVLFVLFASQVPYRIIRLVRRARARRAPPLPA